MKTSRLVTRQPEEVTKVNLSLSYLEILNEFVTLFHDGVAQSAPKGQLAVDHRRGCEGLEAKAIAAGFKETR
ncbi:MAG: hypothetical protein NTU95_10445 [Methanothrix sp.]|nr:hypothetical protein [Methanothrix sp.]